MNSIVMLFIVLITLYPFWYCLVSSFSRIDTGSGFLLWPNGYTVGAYRILYNNRTVWSAYRNTMIRTVLGTALALIFTALTAYPLSKKELPFRGFFTNYIIFTMLFSGGIIPSYLLIKNLGIMNTVWALVLPNLVGAYNVFIMRNFFRSIPESLEESAMLDGAGWFTLLWRIIIPVSKPVFATVALWILVWHWNSYFDAMVYIQDTDKTVLQVILRRISVERNSMDVNALLSRLGQADRFPNLALECAMIIVAVLPMIAIYPFVQKYFVKGIMIGSIKG